jgi:hypothetical protein
MLYDMAASSTRINARLGAELSRKLAAVQRRTKQPLTDIVTASLELYCDKALATGGSFAALCDAGFVGCADGPRDLSENYKEELTRGFGSKA